MNKSELIGKISEVADLPQTKAEAALNAATETIINAMKDGDTVSLVGFGSFSVKERAARTGRNPQTGEVIEIAASKNVGFKAGKALKDSVNEN